MSAEPAAEPAAKPAAEPAAEPLDVAGLLSITVDPGALTGALRTVIDPELGVNIVDLGLVYNAEVVGGVARILITTTTPACPLGPYLSDAIRWALLDIDGVLDVDIEVTYDPLWSPDLMSEEAKVELGWLG
jgi:metal-sulfur cluster biosynthetic enzyme